MRDMVGQEVVLSGKTFPMIIGNQDIAMDCIQGHLVRNTQVATLEATAERAKEG
jgi:hypothetical protein